jgi:hypothetical protein
MFPEIVLGIAIVYIGIGLMLWSRPRARKLANAYFPDDPTVAHILLIGCWLPWVAMEIYDLRKK